MWTLIALGALGPGCSKSQSEGDDSTPDAAGAAAGLGGETENGDGGSIMVPVDGSDPENQTGETVTVPIELLGEPGFFQSIRIDLSEAPSNDAYLSLTTHRLTWREDGQHATTTNPRNAVRPGTKGSVRVNDGSWIPLSNETVTCEAHEAEFGCLNGSYQTVRVRVDMSTLGEPGLSAGENQLSFRFDETDGISSGWRVLSLDVREPDGSSVMTTELVEDDPDTWEPPLPDDADIEAGRSLWHNRALTDLGFENERHPIRAKCSSCHVSDGFDLAYFNYSNRSIIARSVFHGLSETEGQQIASYIRSLDLGLPEGYSASDAGRPWDPPYQPGPGLDALPVELWAAGAGLEAVLEKDRDMHAFFFPSGEYDAAILGADGFLNPREVPQAFQYPDWNTWLPTIGIEDLVEDPSELSGSLPVTRLTDAINYLEEHRYSDMLDDEGVRNNGLFLIRMWIETRNTVGFPTELYYTSREEAAPPRTFELSVKQHRHNLARVSWYNLRQFELNQKYDLEGWTEKTEAAGRPVVPEGYRSWGRTLRTMFETAPHFVSDHAGLDFNMTQPGNYLSTAWYSLEQIINGGYKAGAFGIDWNYHPGHIANTAYGATGFYNDGPIHTHRMAWALIWMYQSVPDSDYRMSPETPWTPSSFGFSQRQLGQGLDLILGGQTQVEQGDMTQAELNELQEALALAFLGVAERYTPDQWVRRPVDDDEHRSADTFETVDYVADFDPDNNYDLPERGYQADAYYARIKWLKESGRISDGTLNRLVDWALGVWPLGAWELLRP